ncbi:unnamed protein product [Closterium sp. NIES-53]
MNATLSSLLSEPTIVTPTTSSSTTTAPTPAILSAIHCPTPPDLTLIEQLVGGPLCGPYCQIFPRQGYSGWGYVGEGNMGEGNLGEGYPEEGGLAGAVEGVGRTGAGGAGGRGSGRGGGRGNGGSGRWGGWGAEGAGEMEEGAGVLMAPIQSPKVAPSATKEEGVGRMEEWSRREGVWFGGGRERRHAFCGVPCAAFEALEACLLVGGFKEEGMGEEGGVEQEKEVWWQQGEEARGLLPPLGGPFSRLLWLVTRSVVRRPFYP